MDKIYLAIDVAYSINVIGAKPTGAIIRHPFPYLFLISQIKWSSLFYFIWYNIPYFTSSPLVRKSSSMFHFIIITILTLIYLWRRIFIPPNRKIQIAPEFATFNLCLYYTFFPRFIPTAYVF